MQRNRGYFKGWGRLVKKNQSERSLLEGFDLAGQIAIRRELIHHHVIRGGLRMGNQTRHQFTQSRSQHETLTAHAGCMQQAIHMAIPSHQRKTVAGHGV